MTFFSGQIYTEVDVAEQIAFQKRRHANATTTDLEDLYAPGTQVELCYAELGVQNKIDAMIVSFSGEIQLCKMELYVQLVNGAYMLLKLTDTTSVVIKNMTNVIKREVVS